MGNIQNGASDAAVKLGREFYDFRLRDDVESAAWLISNEQRGRVHNRHGDQHHKAAVLITGETGVGKELVARIIHEHSNRCAKPWVDLNCAALPEHLVESELFGYEKGAFSGADSAKSGLFEIANGGTLFLDEIGELDPKVQVKLLRVLDGVPYYRLGGNKKVWVDVRVVAATNRDLDASVNDGAFRRDLYHRISEVHINVPPLRERHQDIVALAEYFLARNCPDARFTPKALKLLPHFEWRGNVRELRNLVLKLAILNSHHEITAQEVRQHPHDSATNGIHAAARPFSEISSIAGMGASDDRTGARNDPRQPESCCRTSGHATPYLLPEIEPVPYIAGAAE